jgi:hypothetical protein
MREPFVRPDMRTIVRQGSPKIGWSQFALDRHPPEKGHSRFTGTPEELLDLVAAHWEARQPGAGRAGLDEVVVVPVPPERFVSSTVRVDDETPLRAELTRREPEEEPVIRVLAGGRPEPARFAKVVFYASSVLLQNDGRRTTDADWEVVAVLAGAVDDEPMHPITMARNFLERPGGTYAPYTSQQFAEAIWYWSRRAKLDPELDAD